MHLEIGPALQRVEDMRGDDTTAVLPGARLSLRGTYGVSDYVAVEVGLGGTFGMEGDIGGQSLPAVPGRDGVLRQREHTLRLTFGATARLGVQWIPTVTALAGFQHRIVPDGFLTHPSGVGGQAVAGRGFNDVLVGIGIGHDFRLGEHWIVGLSVQLLYGLSLDGNSFAALEAPLHASWYWYPRW